MTNPVFSDGSDEDTIRRWTQEARALSGVKAPDALVCALAPILSSSSHLSQLASRYHEDIIRLWQGEAEAILSEAEEQFIQNITAAKDDEEVKTVLRQFRNRSHFAIALAEMFSPSSFKDSLRRLSCCAELAVSETLRYLLRPARPETSGWVVLALGKLGAEELNYSSDIDLICLHDADASLAHFSTSHTEPGPFFALKARQLAQLLSSQTKDGFGWRVDYRLRLPSAIMNLWAGAGREPPLSEPAPLQVTCLWDFSSLIQYLHSSGAVPLITPYLMIWRSCFSTVSHPQMFWVSTSKQEPGASDILNCSVIVFSFWGAAVTLNSEGITR